MHVYYCLHDSLSLHSMTFLKTLQIMTFHNIIMSWKVGANILSITQINVSLFSNYFHRQNATKLPLVTITLWSCLIGSTKLSWFIEIKCHGNIYEYAHQHPVFHDSEKWVSNCKILRLLFLATIESSCIFSI